MNKPNTIESVYDGLLESVRRVDNFPKPDNKYNVKNISLELLLEIMDKEVSGYVEKAKKLTVLNDEIELAECYASADAIDNLREIVLLKLNKGE